MAPSATHRSFIGVAKETTKGTAVTPTGYIPMLTFGPKRNPTPIDDTGWRGAPVDAYGRQQGKVVSEFQGEGNLHVDTFGFWLKCLFGDETLTGSSPYTHAFAILNTGDFQGPALTITDQIGGIEARAWPGCQLSEVKLKIDVDGNITYSVSGMGFPEASASSPTASFSTIAPLQGWRISTNVNGTAAQLAGCEVTFSRPVTAIKTTNGTQNPFAVWQGPLSVAVTGAAIAEANTHLENLKNDTQGVFSLTGTRGAGATAETLTVTCTVCAYEGVDIDRSKDWVEFPLSLKPVANTTDVGTSAGFSPAKVTLVNARSTVY